MPPNTPNNSSYEDFIANGSSPVTSNAQTTEAHCPICLEPYFDRAPRATYSDDAEDPHPNETSQNIDNVASINICGHIFHLTCLINSLQNDNRCPMCRQQLYPRSNQFLDDLQTQNVYVNGPPMVSISYNAAVQAARDEEVILRHFRMTRTAQGRVADEELVSSFTQSVLFVHQEWSRERARAFAVGSLPAYFVGLESWRRINTRAEANREGENGVVNNYGSYSQHHSPR